MKQSGEVTISDPGSDRPVLTVATLQCCHCGKHWIPRPGSGVERGYCYRCNGYVCGRDCNRDCVPVEQYLENLEKGRPADYRPIIVPTGDF